MLPFTIFRASGKEREFVTFTRWISFSNFQRGQSLEKAEWSPLQLMHFAGLSQSASACSVEPHFGQVALRLHCALWCPNSWHLKHRKGFGMKVSTFTFKYPTNKESGLFGTSNVIIKVFVGTADPSFLIVIRRTPVTDWSARVTTYSADRPVHDC